MISYVLASTGDNWPTAVEVVALCLAGAVFFWCMSRW